MGDIKLETGEVITDPELLVLNIKPSALVLDLPEEGEEGEEGAEEGDEEGDSEDGEDKKDDA